VVVETAEEVEAVAVTEVLSEVNSREVVMVEIVVVIQEAVNAEVTADSEVKEAEEIVVKVQVAVSVQEEEMEEVASAVPEAVMVEIVAKETQEVDVQDLLESHLIKNQINRISCNFYGNQKHCNYCTR
jgi:hypothetical protein